MYARKVKVTWENGTTSYYESVATCAKRLNSTPTTIRSYIKGYGPLGSKFEYINMSGEEQLLRHVLNTNPVVRSS